MTDRVVFIVVVHRFCAVLDTRLKNINQQLHHDFDLRNAMVQRQVQSHEAMADIHDRVELHIDLITKR